MTMNMGAAFQAPMLVAMIRRSVAEGSYDTNNDWVDGLVEDSTIYGVLTSGNRFSQFDEGISIHSEDGGKRYSDFKSLYVRDKYAVGLDDKVIFKGIIYNILQKSDEAHFGFESYLVEKTKERA